MNAGGWVLLALWSALFGVGLFFMVEDYVVRWAQQINRWVSVGLRSYQRIFPSPAGRHSTGLARIGTPDYAPRHKAGNPPVWPQTIVVSDATAQELADAADEDD
jgi:hypothetical protein